MKLTVFFFFSFSSFFEQKKNSFRFFLLYFNCNRLNTFAGLPPQSYKLAAMRELHIGIPGDGDGWDTSTYIPSNLPGEFACL